MDKPISTPLRCSALGRFALCDASLGAAKGCEASMSTSVLRVGVRAVSRTACPTTLLASQVWLAFSAPGQRQGW
jgi:hypothetical protein